MMTLYFNRVHNYSGTVVSLMALYFVACVASVSVEFSAQKSRFSYIWTRAKWGENEKREGEGRREGERKRLPANPMILQNDLLTPSRTPCGFVVKVRWKQSALGQDLLLFSVCPKYSKPGNFVSFNPDGV